MVGSNTLVRQKKKGLVEDLKLGRKSDLEERSSDGLRDHRSSMMLLFPLFLENKIKNSLNT